MIKRMLSASMAMVALFFSGCSSNSEANSLDFITKSDLLGNWVVEKYNNKKILTNDVPLFSFLADTKLAISYGSTDVNGNMLWNEIKEIDFVLDKNVVEASNNSIYLKLRVNDLTANVLDYTLQAFTIHDKPVAKLGAYEATRSAVTNDRFISGIWQGKENTPGVTDAEEFRYEFHIDGTFTRFRFDKTIEEWVAQPQLSGTFLLYNSYMVLSYAKETTGGGSISQYEAWIVRIEPADKMAWSALRDGNKNISFTFTKQ